MKAVRASAPQLAGVEPYDPKYLPARVLISANENPRGAAGELARAIAEEVARVPLNRYPDPLANDLRDMIAVANGLSREQVLVGNGGDELLFNLALAWGGPGRTYLDFPPTFSVYAANARLTNTQVETMARRADFSIDEQAACARLAQGDIDFTVVTSPNNPTGECVPAALVEALLDASDALVVVDEAYGEFAGQTVLPLLAEHENLLILRTFSKAYGLAGVRVGYVLGSPQVIRELVKVRQPYSVDAVSQAIARVVYANRAALARGVREIVSERGRLFEALRAKEGVTVYPSDANFLLVRFTGGAARAQAAWQALYDAGVLVRDFSHAPLLEGCLRVSVGAPEENDAFLAALREFLSRGEGAA